MGYETRRNRRYYYLKIRRGRQVISCYLGRAAVVGPLLDGLPSVRALADARREDARAARARVDAYLDSISAPARAVYQQGQQLAAAALLLAGYHLHHRHEWRRRNEELMTKRTQPPATGATPALPAPDSPEHIRALVTAAQSGDAHAAHKLAPLLQAGHPAVPQYRTMARQAWGTIAHAHARGDELAATAFLQELEAMAARLLGEGAGAIESALVEEIVTCYAVTRAYDLFGAAGVALLLNGDEKNLSITERLQKMQARAQQRYLNALRTLATVRKLALPVLQFNIGQQQVIGAGDVIAGTRPPPGE